jgi:Uma2 family endonuclease
MTVPHMWPLPDRPMTVADLDDTPDDGCRYELDDGVLVVSAAPLPVHQRVLHRLEVLLEAACPPDLAVEIASPSTAAYDRNRKKIVYAEFGIPAYWIVDPDRHRPSITAFGLRAGAYAEVGRAVAEERFAADVPFPVEIVPAELVAAAWRP